jgi:hypothetical protein
MKMVTAFAQPEIVCINHSGGGTPYPDSGNQVYYLIIGNQHLNPALTRLNRKTRVRKARQWRDP